MSTIVINDLPMSRALDRKALRAIKGGGAPWVFGWIRPYVDRRPGFCGVMNFYQITNVFQAEQMINQFQVIEVSNTGADSTISVGTEASGDVQRSNGALPA
jgi:hypothetical protein